MNTNSSQLCIKKGQKAMQILQEEAFKNIEAAKHWNSLPGGAVGF